MVNDCIENYLTPDHARPSRIIELGGGQGWASCLVKKWFPESFVIATDISPYALESLPRWEQVLNSQVDQSYACKSYGTQEGNESVDFIFVFSAAHHFICHKKTLQEFRRILKPGGKAFYWHEPSTPRILYQLAVERVNRKRPEVPEDVLIPSELKKISLNAV